MAAIKRLVLIVLLSAAALPGAFAGGIVFSDTQWNTGELEPGLVSEHVLEITNETGAALSLSFISTCSCLNVSAGELVIPAGESSSLTLYFDSSDDSGDFEKILIIETDSDSMPKGIYLVSGSVSAGTAGGPEASVSMPPARAESEVPGVAEYYYTPGCRSCNEFINGAGADISLYDITEASNYERLVKILAGRNVPLRRVPVLLTQDAVFQGEDEVVAGWSGFPSGAGGGEYPAQEAAAEIAVAFLPVFVAGLLDGINPCAFTTLIFLLSALAAAGRSRREVLVIGLFFTATVFLTYFLIGFGFFKIIRLADSFALLSRALRWILFAVLLVFAALSLWDYKKIREGNTRDIVLQLPGGVKRRMHSSIRTYTKSAALAGSSIIMGFLISVFELGCTGQIYFPTITYIIQSGRPGTGAVYLTVYNLAFILPLAAVFVLSYFGATSQRITKIFRKKLALIKLLTAILFVLFAALLLFF